MRQFIKLVENMILADEADIIEKAAEEFLLSEPPEVPDGDIETAREIARERLNCVAARVHNGILPVWREIVAGPNWRPGDRALGVCWSWNADDAYAHHGGYHHDERVVWLIHGEVSINDVDWKNTVALNCIILEEAEVRLLGNRNVFLKWVEQQNKPGSRVEINKHLPCGPAYKESE